MLRLGIADPCVYGAERAYKKMEEDEEKGGKSSCMVYTAITQIVVILAVDPVGEYYAGKTEQSLTTRREQLKEDKGLCVMIVLTYIIQ